MTKSFAVVALLALVSINARADEDGTTKGLLANGAVATVLGTIAVIAGGVAYGQAEANWNRADGCHGGCTDASIIGDAAGIGLLAAGAAHLAVGIPLLATGIHRRVSAKKRVDVYGAASPSAKGVAATLGVRF